MNLFRRITYSLAIIGTIAGCTQSAIVPTPSAQPPIIPSTTAFVVADTPTPLPTPNISSSPTVQPTPSISIEKGCLTLEEQLPQDLYLTGVWLRQPGNPYLENLDENTKYRIPINKNDALINYDGYFSISPNGKWLAYLDADVDTSSRISRTNGYSLRVINSSGHSLSMGYWPLNFQRIYGWSDDEHLMIELNYFSDNNRRLIILNPFSGKWVELSNPDWLNSLDIENSWFNPNKYNPRLDDVIINMTDHSELRNFKTGELIFGNLKSGLFTDSSWSLDGTMLEITMKDSTVIHIFQNMSEVLKMDVVKYGLVSPDYYGQIYFSNLQWSLNNKKLLLETYSESFVLDIDKQEIYILCFNDKSLELEQYNPSFFYSRDGQYVVTHLLLKGENYDYQFFDVLIDLINKRAYRLPTPNNQDRIGWLVSP